MAKLTQEQLLPIFNAIKKEMQKYEKGNITARFNIEGRYDLWAEGKKIMMDGRERNEVNFSTIIIQNGYVGFYYMPIYTNTADVRSRLPETLLKHLKGKACFHIKSADGQTMKDIKEALRIGHEEYKKNGWV